MGQVSAALRKRLLDQEKEMDTGGLFIRNKGFTKARLRILPAGEEVPGARCVGWYCDALSGKTKSTTSPETYGKPCPIADALNAIKTTGDKAERDRAFEYVNRNTEYWMKVIQRGSEGEGAHPNIRIFQAKPTVYKDIVRWMADEDVGEDITDPEEGCDVLVKKEGSGRQGTSWNCDKMRTSALSDDEELYEAILELNDDMDVRTYFQPVDWDMLAEIYEGLTGEELPESYQEEFGDADAEAGREEEADEEEAEGEDEGEEEAEEEEGEDDEWVEGETAVTFELDGEDVEATYVGPNDEDPDEYGEFEDAEGDVYTVAYEDTEFVEDDGEEEAEEEAEEEGEDEGEEEEPDEAPPSRRRRAARQPAKPSKKKTSKKASSKKAGKKASSKKTSKKASASIRSRMSKASTAAKKKTSKKPTTKKTTSKKKAGKKASSKKKTSKKKTGTRRRRG